MTRRRILDVVVAAYLSCTAFVVIRAVQLDYAGVLHQRSVAALGSLTIALLVHLSLTILLAIVMIVSASRSGLPHSQLIVLVLAIVLIAPITIPAYYVLSARESDRFWPRLDMRTGLICVYSLFAIFFFVLTIGAVINHLHIAQFGWYRVLLRLNSYLLISSWIWFIADVWRRKLSLGAKIVWAIGIILAGAVFLPSYALSTNGPRSTEAPE